MPDPCGPAARIPRHWADLIEYRFNQMAESEGECRGLDAEPIGADGGYQRGGYDARLWLHAPEYEDRGLHKGRRQIGEALALTELARMVADAVGPEGLAADAQEGEGVLAALLLARAFARALPEGPARQVLEDKLYWALGAASAAVASGKEG